MKSLYLSSQDYVVLYIEYLYIYLYIWCLVLNMLYVMPVCLFIGRLIDFLNIGTPFDAMICNR